MESKSQKERQNKLENPEKEILKEINYIKLKIKNKYDHIEAICQLQKN